MTAQVITKDIYLDAVRYAPGGLTSIRTGKYFASPGSPGRRFPGRKAIKLFKIPRVSLGGFFDPTTQHKYNLAQPVKIAPGD